MERIFSGIACRIPGEGTLTDIVTYFGLFPAWVLAFNASMGLIDNDIYFLFASKCVLYSVYVYCNILSGAIRSTRPHVYDHELCGATEYAFPDPLFVSTISYTFVVAVGLYMEKKVGVARLVLLFASVVLYCWALLLTRHFYAWQLFCNLLFSAVTSISFLLSYRFFARYIWKDSGRDVKWTISRLGHLLKQDSTLFTNDLR